MPDLFLEGDFIQHKYQVEKVICSSKGGAVYKCKYHRGNRAIKQIFYTGEDKKEISDLFFNRCEVIKKLSQANLAEIEDYFIEDNVFYVVMEYIKGKNLEKAYKKDYAGSFPPEVLMNCMIKVCEGLKYMHSSSPGLFFGNLSPHNIMIFSPDGVKLINYGIGDIVSYGFIKGETGFSAPEYDKGCKSDIYSIASTMFFLLSGKNFDRKLKGLRRYNRSVPRGLENLLVKCLSENITERPDIEEVFRELSKLYLRETMRKATSVGFSVTVSDKDEGIEDDKDDSVELDEEETVSPDSSITNIKIKKKKKKKSITKEVEEEAEAEEVEVTGEADEIEEVEEVEVTGEEEIKDAGPEVKKKKKKKKKSITGEIKGAGELSSPAVKETEEIEEIEEIEEEEIKDAGPEVKKKKKKKKKSLTGEIKETEEISLSVPKKQDSLLQQKKKKKISADSKDPDEDILEDDGEFDEFDGFDEDREEESSEKPDKKKKRERKTSILSQMLVDAIKQKEETAEVKEETVEEVEKPPEEKGEEPPGVVEEKKAEEQAGGKTEETSEPSEARRSVSIASFLRMKSGLTDDAYELNKDLLTGGKRRKSGLSEEFLASLKVTSLPSGEARDKGEKITEARFAPYKRPDIPPPLPVYEEADRLKNNRYDVLEVIQKDCYGAVYKIQDYDEKEEGRDEKILKEIQYRGTDPETVEKIAAKFHNAAEELKKLDNPCLVHIEDYFYEFSEDKLGVRLFLIMEYVEGMTFEEIARSYYEKDKKSDMPGKTIFSVTTKLYSALEYLHDRGVVYGDLRPSNIKLTPDGNIKFLNYGLACIFQGLEDEVYPYRGTYGYVAPELISLPEGDSRSDIFSLGALMYFVLTNQNPEDLKYKFLPVRTFNKQFTVQGDRFVHSFLNFTPSLRPDIKQINRVSGSIKFFDEAGLNRNTGILDDLGEAEAQVPETQHMEVVKESFVNVLLGMKKYSAIIAGVLVLFILGFWIYSYTASIFIPKDLFCIVQDKEGPVMFRMATDNVYKEFEWGKCSPYVAFSRERKEMYFLSSIAQIFVLNTGNMKLKEMIPIKDIAYGIALSKDEKTMYISFASSGDVVVYSPAERRELQTLVTGARSACDLLLLDEDNLLVFSDYKASRLFGVDTKTGNAAFAIDTGKGPRRLVFIPGRKLVYVVNWTDNNISVIHTTSRELVATVPAGKNPSAICASSDNKKIYVCNQGDKSLSIINIDGHINLKEIKLEGEPYNITLSPDGEKLYVCLKSDKNKIVILNSINLSLEKEIPLSGSHALSVFFPSWQ